MMDFSLLISIFSWASIELVSRPEILLFFKRSVLVKRLLCLVKIIIVFFTVELSLALEISTWIILHDGHILSHFIDHLLSTIFINWELICFLSDCGLLFWLILLLLELLSGVGCIVMLRSIRELEFFRHWNVQCFKMVDCLICKIIDLPDITLIHIVQQTDIQQRVRWLDLMH